MIEMLLEFSVVIPANTLLPSTIILIDLYTCAAKLRFKTQNSFIKKHDCLRL